MILSCILVLSLSACREGERKAIESLLEQREQALTRGDVTAYLAAFSPQYEDQVFPWKSGIQKIKQRFNSEPRPRLSFKPPEIFINKDAAMVSQGFSLDAVVRGVPRHYRETQHLKLTRGADGWKIVSGSEVYRFLAGRLEEQDLIEQALDRRAEALKHKNLDLYMSVVSPDYDHKGKSANQIRESVEESFEAFDKIDYRAYDRKIWFFGTSATVQQQFSMEARLPVRGATLAGGKDQSRSWSGTERFEMVRTDRGWVITKGL